MSFSSEQQLFVLGDARVAAICRTPRPGAAIPGPWTWLLLSCLQVHPVFALRRMSIQTLGS